MLTANSKSDALLRVLLGSRSATVNEALQAVLSEQEYVKVIATASEEIQTLVLSERELPDVVLLDLERAGITLPPMVRLLKQVSPPPVVIVLVHYSMAALRKPCLESGADYVFEKTRDLAPLLAALQTLRQRPLSGGPSRNEL